MWLALACIALPACASPSGILRIVALGAGGEAGSPLAGVGAVPGTDEGRWRIGIAPADRDRVLVVGARDGARVAVHGLDATAAVPRAIFDADLDPAWSRRALAFTVPARHAGPIDLLIDGAQGGQIPLELVDAALYRADELRHVRAITAALTALLAIAAVVALFWWRMRDPAHLLFAGLLLAEALYLGCASGAILAYASLRWLGVFGSAAPEAAAALVGGLSMLFLPRYVALASFAPRPAPLLRGMGVLLLLLAVGLPWPMGALDGWLHGLALVAGILGQVLLLLALLAAGLAGARVRSVLLAWLPLLVAAAWQALAGAGWGMPGGSGHALSLAMVWGAVVLCSGLADRMLDIRLERDRAMHRAEHDPLTHTLNRATLVSRLDELIAHARVAREQMAVLFVDLDHFKQVNDRLGHHVGDACIRAVIHVIQRELRQSDLLGRYGGEEFVVLLPGAGTRLAHGVAERIRRQVELRCRIVDGHAVQLTVSLGCADLHAGRDNRDSLLKRADQAMYAAKEGGRNRVVCAAVE